MTPGERRRNTHIINGILQKCPYDFKNVDGFWYRKKKGRGGEWELVHYSPETE